MIRLQPNFFSTSVCARSLVSLPALCVAALALIPAPAPHANRICAAQCVTPRGEANTAATGDRLISDRRVRLVRVHTRSVIAAPVTQQPVGPQSAEPLMHPFGGHNAAKPGRYT
jgi:hypothetical protein